MVRSGRLATIQELHTEVEVLKARLEEKEKTLVNQAKEYERRLSELNHAHDEAKDVLSRYGSTYLTIGTFDTFKEGFLLWKTEVDKKTASDSSRSATIAALGAVILAILALASNLLPSLFGR